MLRALTSSRSDGGQVRWYFSQEPLGPGDVAATRPAQGVPAVGEFLRFSARDSDALESHFREDEEGLLRMWWREYAESNSVGPGQGAGRRVSPAPSSTTSTPALPSAPRSPLPSVSSRSSSHASPSSSPRRGARGEQGRGRPKDTWAKRPAGPGDDEASALGPGPTLRAPALAAAAARAQAVRNRELQGAPAQQPLPEAASAPHALRVARAEAPRERGESGPAAPEADSDDGGAAAGEPAKEDTGEEGEGGQEAEECVGVPVKGGLYEVSLALRRSVPVYWEGEQRRVLRGLWFAKKPGLAPWLPLREDLAEQLEAAYEGKVWRRRSFQPSGLFAARVPLVGSVQGLSALFMGEDDTWQAQFSVTSYSAHGLGPEPVARTRTSTRTSFFSFSALHGMELRRGFDPASLDMLPNSKADEQQRKEEALDDYCCQVPVEHVLFMVHGIGQRLQSAHLVEDVTGFRRNALAMAEAHLTPFQRSHHRCLFIPCQWRRGLRLGGEAVVEDITLDGIRALREGVSATVHDVLFYTSPIFRQDIILSLTASLNRLYRKFLRRNPNFTGKVSVYGHSLGSVLLFDILCHQPRALGPPASQGGHPNRSHRMGVQSGGERARGEEGKTEGAKPGARPWGQRGGSPAPAALLPASSPLSAASPGAPGELQRASSLPTPGVALEASQGCAGTGDVLAAVGLTPKARAPLGRPASIGNRAWLGMRRRAGARSRRVFPLRAPSGGGGGGGGGSHPGTSPQEGARTEEGQAPHAPALAAGVIRAAPQGRASPGPGTPPEDSCAAVQEGAGVATGSRSLCDPVPACEGEAEEGQGEEGSGEEGRREEGGGEGAMPSALAEVEASPSAILGYPAGDVTVDAERAREAGEAGVVGPAAAPGRGSIVRLWDRVLHWGKDAEGLDSEVGLDAEVGLDSEASRLQGEAQASDSSRQAPVDAAKGGEREGERYHSSAGERYHSSAGERYHSSEGERYHSSAGSSSSATSSPLPRLWEGLEGGSPGGAQAELQELPGLEGDVTDGEAGLQGLAGREGPAEGLPPLPVARQADAAVGSTQGAGERPAERHASPPHRAQAPAPAEHPGGSNTAESQLESWDPAPLPWPAPILAQGSRSPVLGCDPRSRAGGSREDDFFDAISFQGRSAEASLATSPTAAGAAVAEVAQSAQGSPRSPGGAGAGEYTCVRLRPQDHASGVPLELGLWVQGGGAAGGENEVHEPEREAPPGGNPQERASREHVLSAAAGGQQHPQPASCLGRAGPGLLGGLRASRKPRRVPRGSRRAAFRAPGLAAGRHTAGAVGSSKGGGLQEQAHQWEQQQQQQHQQLYQRQQQQHDLIRFSRLDFKVDTFFAVGSPLGLFLALRNIRLGAGSPTQPWQRGGPTETTALQGAPPGAVEAADPAHWGVAGVQEEHWGVAGVQEELPACSSLINIFHPHDPVAYRLEPLAAPELARVPPALIPYHRGGYRLHIGVKLWWQRVVKQADKYQAQIWRFTCVTAGLCGQSTAEQPAALDEYDEEQADDEEEGLEGEEGEAGEAGAQEFGFPHPPATGGPLPWGRPGPVATLPRKAAGGYQGYPEADAEAGGEPQTGGLEGIRRRRRGHLSGGTKALCLGARSRATMMQLTGSPRGRIDFVLQDPTFEHQYIQAISCHINSWQDQDIALFIIRHLYRAVPRQPQQVQAQGSGGRGMMSPRPLLGAASECLGVRRLALPASAHRDQGGPHLASAHTGASAHRAQGAGLAGQAAPGEPTRSHRPGGSEGAQGSRDSDACERAQGHDATETKTALPSQGQTQAGRAPVSTGLQMYTRQAHGAPRAKHAVAAHWSNALMLHATNKQPRVHCSQGMCAPSCPC